MVWGSESQYPLAGFIETAAFAMATYQPTPVHFVLGRAVGGGGGHGLNKVGHNSSLVEFKNGHVSAIYQFTD